jgi:hypothetical protein
MSHIQMTQLEGGTRSSGGAHIERMRKASDLERVRREVNMAAVNAANEKAAQSRQQSEVLWASLQEAGYTLVSSWRWGQEYFMPTFQEVALMEKATSNMEAAILACKEHAAPVIK